MRSYERTCSPTHSLTSYLFTYLPSTYLPIYSRTRKRQLQLTSDGLLAHPRTYCLLQYGEAGPTTAPKHGENKAAVWAHIQAVLARGGSVEGSA